MCISLPVGIIILIHENDRRPADKLICPCQIDGHISLSAGRLQFLHSFV